MDSDIEMFETIDSPTFPSLDEIEIPLINEKEHFSVDICDVMFKSEKERRKLTLEDLTRLVIKFIKINHPKGDFLNGVELLRFLVYKIGLEEKKIKRRMYDVLQVLAGCGALKRINRKMFFVSIE